MVIIRVVKIAKIQPKNVVQQPLVPFSTANVRLATSCNYTINAIFF
jgi:hypothetical protein